MIYDLAVNCFFGIAWNGWLSVNVSLLESEEFVQIEFGEFRLKSWLVVYVVAPLSLVVAVVAITLQPSQNI